MNWILGIATLAAFVNAAIYAASGDRSQAVLYLVCGFACMGFLGYRVRQMP